MPIPQDGFRLSGFTAGEIRALMAPMLGCSAEDLGDITIVAEDAHANKVGVFTTYYCKINNHWRTRAITMMASGIAALCGNIYDESTQHGPGEGI
jgi:hypothetical protein